MSKQQARIIRIQAYRDYRKGIISKAVLNTIIRWATREVPA
jgi:hypothetical protein